jgi:hypothetical protein
MTALRITVDNSQNALMLVKMLRSMPFVKEIDTDLSIEESKNQFDNLKEVLNAVKPGSVFSEIKDPVEWQKQIRDEW